MKFSYLLTLTTCATLLGGCASSKPLGRDLAIASGEWASKAELWVLSHQDSFGTFPYFFDPKVDQEIGNPHAFGALIAAHRIAQLANERPMLATAHSAQLASILSRFNPGKEPDGLAVDHNGVASLGVNALLLRLLLETSDPTYDSGNQAQSIATHLVNVWEASTGFPENLDKRTIENTYLKRYYTGIAALALLEHFEATQNELSLLTATAALDWLESLHPAEDPKAFHPSPTPWLVEALGRLNEIQPQQKLQQRIFNLADLFIDLQDDDFFPGRFWSAKGPNFGPPNIVRDAQATRSLMTALELAVDLGDQRKVRKYRRAIRLALDNLRAHQYDVGGIETFPNPAGAVGAVRFRYDQPIVRIDGVIFSAMAFERASNLAWQGKL